MRQARGSRSEGPNRRKELRLKLIAEKPLLLPIYGEERIFLAKGEKNAIMLLHPKVWPLVADDFIASGQRDEVYLHHTGLGLIPLIMLLPF